MDQHELSFILNQLGETREQYFGAVTPPIMQTSNFAFPTVAQMRALLQDEFAEHFYTRGNNPTVAILRQKLAALEAAEQALVFASGAAAMAAAVLGFVSQGDEVLCVAKPYSWTRSLLRDYLPRFGVRTHFVEGGSCADYEKAWTPSTRLVVLESPNSMTFEQQDLPGIAALARSRGALSVVDNSYASPLLQQPIKLGIDLVVHSASKYLNGHSDVVAGVICGREELLRQIFRGPYMTLGAIAAPFDAWLMLRGLRTLEVRMQRICQTATQVRAWLQAHPKIRRIWAADPEASLGALKAQSGMFSIELAVEELAGVERFCNSLRHFLMAVSWGGHESLIFPLACVLDEARYRQGAGGLPFGLVRLSIGLEAPEVLIEDLAQALNCI